MMNSHRTVQIRSANWLAPVLRWVVLVCASLLTGFSAQSGPIILNGGKLIINNAALLNNVIINNGGIVTYGGGVVQPVNPLPPPASGDFLHFTDGSGLHGNLSSFGQGTLGWVPSDATNRIRFSQENLDYVLFNKPHLLSLTPNCRVKFVNGDELFAEITSMDFEKVGLKTWFANATVQRSAIRSITLLPPGFAVSYEGPSNDEGWSTAPPGGWWCRDGALSSRAGGILSRDFKLNGPTTVEFDVAYAPQLGLLINFFTDKDQLEFAGNSWAMFFSGDTVELKHGQNHEGISLGKASQVIPPDRFHVAINFNTAENAVTLFIDGKFIKKWKDTSSPAGSRILFADMSGRIGLVLSNFRVCRWTGRDPALISSGSTNSDALSFVNQDRASGTIAGMDHGKVSFILRGKQVEVPIQRITRVDFACTNASAALPGSGDVRARFDGGGMLSFHLDDWNNKTLTGHNDIFGNFSIEVDTIRRLEFKPGQSKPETASVRLDEFGGLDD